MERKKPLTIKACYEEMERVLKIYLYQNHSKDEEKVFRETLKSTIETKGRLEQKKMQEAEERRADRYARSYGVRR